MTLVSVICGGKLPGQASFNGFAYAQWARCPRKLLTIVARATAYDPNARFQTAAEFCQALDAALHPPPEDPTPVPARISTADASPSAATPMEGQHASPDRRFRFTALSPWQMIATVGVVVLLITAAIVGVVIKKSMADQQAETTALLALRQKERVNAEKDNHPVREQEQAAQNKLQLLQGRLAVTMKDIDKLKSENSEQRQSNVRNGGSNREQAQKDSQPSTSRRTDADNLPPQQPKSPTSNPEILENLAPASAVEPTVNIDVDTRLSEAQTEYVSGNYLKAIDMAKSVQKGSPVRAWRIIGSAACNTKNLKLANDAFRRLDAPGRQYIVYVCQRNGIVPTRLGQLVFNDP